MKEDKTGTTAYNRPHQPIIHYSARGYDEFRADLIERLEAGGFAPRGGDFVDAFVDLTAYLGEALMTYQNAYAQEIFLETAQTRESLFNFAAMVDYKIDPGAAAVGALVVEAKPGKSGLLPKGFQVSGKEEGAKKPVFFETDADLNVDCRYNDFALAGSERFTPLAIGNQLTIRGKIRLKTGSHIYFHSDSGDLFAQVQSSTVDAEKETTTVDWMKESAFKTFTSPPKVGSGDWSLVNPEPRGLLQINADEVLLDGKYEDIAAGAPLILKTSEGKDFYGAVAEVRFEMGVIETGILKWISENEADKEKGETERYNYTIKVVVGEGGEDKTFHALEKPLTEVREATRLTVSWFSTPVNYTGTTLEKSIHHVVYAGGMTKPDVVEEKKNESLLSGETILEVDGDFSGMEKYRALILYEKAGGRDATEEAIVQKVLFDDPANRSYIELKAPVSRRFSKHGVRIRGNVVKATQGKTAPEATLGSARGDEAHQAFALPKSPLTHERRGREGVKAAMDLKVSGVPWEQKEHFLHCGPGDRHYVIETDCKGKSRVVFGDGASGARPPTGRDNVTAGFRTGQGKDGCVSAGVLKKAVSKPVFFKKVFNSSETSGGSDPSTDEQIMEKIPVEHLTFDRAVSLADYGNLALAYPGVAKARAGWRWIDQRYAVLLAAAGDDGRDISPILKDLRPWLDARRDVNQPLVVAPAGMVRIALSMEIVVRPDYDAERVKGAVEKALGTGKNDDGSMQFFCFDRLRMGMSIHKKDIYRAVENIPGVQRIRGLAIGRSGTCENAEFTTPSPCAGSVRIHDWEIAALDALALDIAARHLSPGIICGATGDPL